VLFLQGDMISGPVSTDYGPGVADLNVQPTRDGVVGAIAPRFFTHTLYWTYPRGQNVPVPDHVAVLRDAVNVLDDPAIEQRLMERLVGGPPGAGAQTTNALQPALATPPPVSAPVPAPQPPPTPLIFHPRHATESSPTPLKPL
jgi:hypothetical protein